jgi:hypothetical protein
MSRIFTGSFGARVEVLGFDTYHAVDRSIDKSLRGHREAGQQQSDKKGLKESLMHIDVLSVASSTTCPTSNHSDTRLRH